MRDKILYVDDEFINLYVFEKTLSRHFDVVTSNSGEEALKTVEEDRDIALIITDLRMPGLSGLDLIHEVKKINNDIIFFILSGYPFEGAIKEAYDNGVIQKFYSKPYNDTIIINGIKEELEKKRPTS